MNRPTFRTLRGRLALAVVGCILCDAAFAADPLPAVAVCRPGELETADHDFPGRIGPDDPVEVRAPANGVVKKVAIRAGDSVRKGDVLFECQWAGEPTENCPAAVAVRGATAELKRLTDAAEEAGKLAKSTPAELTKEYEAALNGLKEPLDKTLKHTAAAITAGLPPARRDAAQKLYSALDRTLRLGNARRDSSLDAFYEGELTRLRPAVTKALGLLDVRGAAPATEECVANLRALRKAIDRAILVSRARSKEGLEALAAERDLAAAILKNAGDGLEAARRDVCPERVLAPVAGRVVRVGPRPGDKVESAARAATLLCVLAPTATVRVAFDMDEATLERLQQLARGGKLPVKELSDLPVRLALPAEDNYPHSGKLTYLEPRLDPKSHLLRCRAAFPNADGALTKAAFARDGKGETVVLRLTLGEPRKVLLVPRQSVLTDADGKSQVLVVDEKNRVESRPVRTGADYGGLRTVTEGLRATDWVVVGPAGAKKAAGDAALSPADFVSDLRLLNLKPGSAVEPLHVPLPETDGSRRPKP